MKPAGLGNETQDALKRPPGKAASAQVVRLVSHLIETGELTPGQRVVEADIGERLAVGRSSVREGLRLLAVDGIVSVDFNRGVTVRRYTVDEVLALHDIRAVLEALAAGLAARLIDNEEGGRERLSEVLQAAGEAVAAADIPAFAAQNKRFHDLIVEISGNPFIASHIVQAKTAYFRLQMGLLDPAEIARSQREHERIVKAIFSGRPDNAERAMRAHIQSSRNRVLKTFPNS